MRIEGRQTALSILLKIVQKITNSDKKNKIVSFSVSWLMLVYTVIQKKIYELRISDSFLSSLTINS